MNMPSKSSGKIITKIRINKNSVSIFFGKEKISLSYSAFSESYLFVGKELSQSDINNLLKHTEITKMLDYAFSLLSKKHYSEWVMREKLYAKETSVENTNKIINILKKNDLIDDNALCYDLIEYFNEKNYGKNKIVNELLDKGIFMETIKKYSFPASKEKAKAKNQVIKLEKKYQKLSYENKRKHIYNSLLSLGFDNDIANQALVNIKEFNQKDESEKLNKDFEKIYRRLSSRYEGKELREKLYVSLRNKGYRNNDAKRIIGEHLYDD